MRPGMDGGFDSLEAVSGPRNAAIEAERAVLGALLVAPERLDEAVEAVGEADFFRHAHRLIWTAIRTVAASGSAVDLLTVKAALGPAIEDVGGPSYLSALSDGVPRLSSVAHYARLVREYAVRRAVEQVGRDLTEAAIGGEESSADLLARGETALLGLRTTQPGTAVDAPAERTSALMATLEAAQQGKRRGTMTGLQELDAMTYGFRPGQLIVLGARPAQGKTALALSMAVGAGAHGPVLFCSLEMSTEQINLREMSLRSSISHTALDAGRIDGKQRQFTDALQAMHDGQVHVLDRPGATLSQIRGAARRLRASHGSLGLIVVDYLQLMRPERGTRSENRTIEVAQFSGGLKLLARELEVPVIALSQLSRESERRADKKPMLADLRESGALEQDADTVLLLHRPGVYDAHVPDTRAELIISKQRNGPTGTAHLAFDPETMRFSDQTGVTVCRL